MDNMIMQRTGTFMIEVSGPNHCGTHDHHEQMKYHMIATCSPHFDKRGFLFDQLSIDNYFQSIKKTTKSCEQLTVDCCSQLLKLIRDEALAHGNQKCPVLHIKLSLSPNPFAAEMTAEMGIAEIEQCLNEPCPNS